MDEEPRVILKSSFKQTNDADRVNRILVKQVKEARENSETGKTNVNSSIMKSNSNQKQEDNHKKVSVLKDMLLKRAKETIILKQTLEHAKRKMASIGNKSSIKHQTSSSIPKNNQTSNLSNFKISQLRAQLITLTSKDDLYKRVYNEVETFLKTKNEIQFSNKNAPNDMKKDKENNFKSLNNSTIKLVSKHSDVKKRLDTDGSRIPLKKQAFTDATFDFRRSFQDRVFTVQLDTFKKSIISLNKRNSNYNEMDPNKFGQGKSKLEKMVKIQVKHKSVSSQLKYFLSLDKSNATGNNVFVVHNTNSVNQQYNRGSCKIFESDRNKKSIVFEQNRPTRMSIFGTYRRQSSITHSMHDENGSSNLQSHHSTSRSKFSKNELTRFTSRKNNSYKSLSRRSSISQASLNTVERNSVLNGINRVAKEINERFKFPMLKLVRSSVARKRTSVSIGTCSDYLNTVISKDTVEFGSSITRMRWFTQNDNIRGFIFNFRNKSRIVEGQVHGQKTDTFIDINIRDNDELSYILYCHSEERIKSIKFITAKHEIHYIGIHIDDLEEYDVLSSVDIFKSAWLVQVMSYFCKSKGNLHKLYIEYS